MKYAVSEVEKRLWLFGGELFSGNGMGAWCYNADQKMYYSTNPNWQEFQMFLQISGILGAITSEVSEDPNPLIYTDDLGLFWIAERVNFQDGGALFIVCGPAYIKGHSKEDVLERLSTLNLSVTLRMKYAQALSEIPVLSGETLGIFSRMLHFTIYDEFLSLSYLKFAGEDKREEKKNSDAEKTEEGIHFKGKGPDFSRMREIRKLLLDSVRNGVFEEKSESKSAYNGELQDYDIHDELRTVKNHMIIFQSKCAEAAIEGGLSEKAAMERQNQAIREIEECRSISKLANVNWDAFLGFVHAVHEAKQLTDNGISGTVQEAMNYILNHYREPLSLSDLAREAGYSEYYLSRKFTKETGMKIQDYIKQTRINMAKVMLTSTRKDIFQIAEELQFKSRSHFDKTFTQLAGASPAKYRETMGRVVRKI